MTKNCCLFINRKKSKRCHIIVYSGDNFTERKFNNFLALNGLIVEHNQTFTVYFSLQS